MDSIVFYVVVVDHEIVCTGNGYYYGNIVTFYFFAEFKLANS